MGIKVYLLVFAVMMGMWTWQIISYFEFKHEVTAWANKGPRFTTIDGQALCERVKQLEKESKPCNFNK